MALLRAIKHPDVAHRLTTLTLKNLIAFANDFYGVEPHFINLTQLCITVAPCLEECNVRFEPLKDFWSGTISRDLSHPYTHLTSLTLHSDQDVGFVPGLAFSHLFYPHLTDLSLCQINFDSCDSLPPKYPDLTVVGVEEFIARHKATLSRLELRECKIASLGTTITSLLGSGVEPLPH
ncbi:hypothetical protein OF83DRAFT_894277 [Amylostereum chailletii]|nr:hypothetical protein OF83DRAFT_894277 [Amylostereum chailletii]